MTGENAPVNDERLERTHEALRNQREWLMAEGHSEERVDEALDPVMEFVEERMLGTDQLDLTDENKSQEGE